jgi:hypothetical protein
LFCAQAQKQLTVGQGRLAVCRWTRKAVRKNPVFAIFPGKVVVGKEGFAVNALVD